MLKLAILLLLMVRLDTALSSMLAVQPWMRSLFVRRNDSGLEWPSSFGSFIVSSYNRQKHSLSSLLSIVQGATLASSHDRSL